MTSLNEGTGNPNAKQLVSRPEAGASGRRVAPTPPGQVPYMAGKCGVIRNDGKICTRERYPGGDTCLGHTPKTPRSQREHQG